jgi:hypothetical protein
MEAEKTTTKHPFDAKPVDADDEMHDDIPMENLESFKKDIEFDKITPTEVLYYEAFVDLFYLTASMVFFRCRSARRARSEECRSLLIDSRL